jgi:hypothetical protein
LNWKGLERSGRDLIVVLSQNLLVGPKEDHERPSVRTKILERYTNNSLLDLDCIINPLIF